MLPVIGRKATSNVALSVLFSPKTYRNKSDRLIIKAIKQLEVNDDGND